MPSPADYYRQHVADLGPVDTAGRASAPCPFHSHEGAALVVQLVGNRGGWRCEAGCGGGDLVGFHMRRMGLGFKAAVRDLVMARPA